MADSGFQGLQNDVPERSVALPYKGSRTHPLTPEQKLHNATLSCIRIVVENTLAEMKHFRILADVFRHSMSLYDAIFVSIAGFVTRRADQRHAVWQRSPAERPVAATPPPRGSAGSWARDAVAA